MKDSFWWLWIKGLFNKSVPVAKEPSAVDRRVADYYIDRQQRQTVNEKDTKRRLAEILAGIYKANFEKTAMFLLGYRPNPEYLNLLAVGFPQLSMKEITELFYQLSEETEHVTQMFLETPAGVCVDVPTPIYDKVIATYCVNISFMGDIYPIDGTPPYLIKRYGVWTVMHIPGKFT